MNLDKDLPGSAPFFAPSADSSAPSADSSPRPLIMEYLLTHSHKIILLNTQKSLTFKHIFEYNTFKDIFEYEEVS